LQITVGISELADPINIPIGVTVNKGNVLDLDHFSDTYNQVKRYLEKVLLLFLITELIPKIISRLYRMLRWTISAMKLNLSDDKVIENFALERAELIGSEKVYLE
jgi:transposase